VGGGVAALIGGRVREGRGDWYGQGKPDKPHQPEGSKPRKYLTGSGMEPDAIFLAMPDKDYWFKVWNDKSIPGHWTEGAKKAGAGLSIELATIALTGVWPVMERMAAIEELLGKLSAPAMTTMNRQRQELKAANKQLAEWDAELNQLHQRNGDLGLEVQMLEQELKEVQRSREENKNSAPIVAEFPEPANLLNLLKTRRKKSGANLADMEVVLEILSYLEKQD
jgi:archaellum component FlaC